MKTACVNGPYILTCFRLRIYQYYLPVYFWVERQLADHHASGAQQPLVVRHHRTHFLQNIKHVVRSIMSFMTAELTT